LIQPIATHTSQNQVGGLAAQGLSSGGATSITVGGYFISSGSGF